MAGPGESAYYGGDLGAEKYSPLDQINTRNIQSLKVAWRHAGVDPQILQTYPKLKVSNNLRSTPLMIKGVLYVSNGLGLVEAMDPATGKTLWTQEPVGVGIEGMQGVASRAISYWTDGSDARIVTVRGQYLFAVDAKTGKASEGFGSKGRVDLTDSTGRQRFAWTAPGPLVVKDVIVIGGQALKSEGDFISAMLPGDIRGYDIHTGKQLWVFHTIPQEGEFGADTWLNGSNKTNGKAKTWSLFSADEDLGYVYAPLSAAANDWYGGLRPGSNLFADSLVCLDAKTGKRVWHYQLVHHDLWDYDLPTAPILADLTVDGKKIKAVLQVTKTAWVFAFDRVTGKPIWPIVEKPVPQTNVSTEWTSPTQPFPTKPAPFDRQGLTDNDLIDFTPELHAEAVEMMKHYVHGQIFTPPSLKGEGPDGNKGTLYLPGWVGGANWTGAAMDPETGILYVPSVSVPYLVGLSKNGDGYRRPREATLYVDGPQGLPLVKPPYGHRYEQRRASVDGAERRRSAQSSVAEGSASAAARTTRPGGAAAHQDDAIPGRRRHGRREHAALQRRKHVPCV